MDLNLLQKKGIRQLALVLPIVLGILALVTLKACKNDPEKNPENERARTVRFIEAPLVAVAPLAIGYGTAQPGNVWKGVAEVSGKVVSVHPRFKEGEILPSGTEVLKIDPTRYQLAVAQFEASIQQSKAQLDELSITQTNLSALLEIEKRTLDLNARELDRNKELLSKNAVPAVEVDREERAYLAQQNKVRQLENEISLLPTKRDTLKAQIELIEAQLEDAKFNLENTEVKLPFDARLADTPVEIGQFVNTGTLLAEADSVNLTEVVTDVPLEQMRLLVQSGSSSSSLISLGPDFDLSGLIESFGLSATVRINAGTFQAEWEARVVRFLELVDPQTRTIGVVVAVDQPYLNARPGIRPPLLKGMFCEVELRGKPGKERVILPRPAWHDGFVYIVNKENRLERRSVETAYFQNNFAVLENGIEPGEKIVVSDLSPAVEGMLLNAVVDPGLFQQIIEEATGRPAEE